MERTAQIEQPRGLTRILFKIGERMFGQVPTAERLMARRLPLMLGFQTFASKFAKAWMLAPQGFSPQS